MLVCVLALSFQVFAKNGEKKDERDRKPRKSISDWAKPKHGDGENPCRAVIDACRRAGHYDVERYGENKQKMCIDDVLHERPVDRVSVSPGLIERCRKHKNRKK